jgi:hypothetical protein
MPKRYAQYSVNDFDKFDCVKLSKTIFLILAFVLRGYLIWIISVSNMQDKVGIMQWVFPEKEMFYLSLVSGSIGLFIALIISLRRPDAAEWVKWSWRQTRILLVFAMFFDLLISVLGFTFFQLLSMPWLMVQACLAVVASIYLFKNKKVAINLAEFPEKIPEK